MEVITTDIPEVPAQNAVPAKKIFKLKETVNLTGDGRTLLQLLQDQVNTMTGLDDILATGKTIPMSIKFYMEAEAADLS